MNDDQSKPAQPESPSTTDTEHTTDTDNIKFDAETGDAGTDDTTDADFPEMDENMFGQVQEMMAKLQRADDLEKENADLRNKLGRLAADFESYRTRTQQDVAAAQGQGVSKAAQALMPVYDDLDRAVSVGVDDPAKLIPGMQAVQSKILNIFGTLGLEATGKEGESFDPQWHEAIQVVEGDEDDKIVTVYQTGFKMDDKLVRPARVVVSRKG